MVDACRAGRSDAARPSQRGTSAAVRRPLVSLSPVPPGQSGRPASPTEATAAARCRRSQAGRCKRHRPKPPRPRREQQPIGFVRPSRRWTAPRHGTVSQVPVAESRYRSWLPGNSLRGKSMRFRRVATRAEKDKNPSMPRILSNRRPNNCVGTSDPCTPPRSRWGFRRA